MTRPIVEKGNMRIIVEIDPKTGKRTVRRLRDIFTDAVGPNASVSDESAFKDAIDDAIAQTKVEDIDGLNFEPLPGGNKHSGRAGSSS